jgi:hypothetical protein
MSDGGANQRRRSLNPGPTENHDVITGGVAATISALINGESDARGAGSSGGRRIRGLGGFLDVGEQSMSPYGFTERCENVGLWMRDPCRGGVVSAIFTDSHAKLLMH